MRASHSLVLLVLTFTAVSVAAYLRAPLETRQVRELSTDSKRYISDPLSFEAVVYTSSLNIGGKNYRLVVVRTHDYAEERSNLAKSESRWRPRNVATSLPSSKPHFLAFLTPVAV